MGIRRGNVKSEDFEWISNRDLVDSAHMLMGEIDLDPASSAFANPYVGAKKFYNPVDDGLNDQKWFGKVYLFSTTPVLLLGQKKRSMENYAGLVTYACCWTLFMVAHIKA